jgi:nucleoside-diphosphate-sugar epimerase
LQHIVITGAGGFLGTHLAAMAKSSGAETVTLIHSPRAPQGLDLAGNDAVGALQQRFPIPDPEETAVIHAAAFVQWDSAEAVIQNSMMAFNVASWIVKSKIRFAVLVSSVSAGIEDPPQTRYGVGKLAAENIWRVLLANRQATVRLAGIWGWQRRPSLFWNRVLVAAAGKENAQLHVCKKHSRRNYIHAEDASRALLALAKSRGSGSFIAAGRDALSTQEFVEAVQRLPGARLTLNHSDHDSGEDELYACSPELLPYIRPFPEALAETWRSKPEWTTQ